MKGSAGVMALVSAETVAGSSALLWLSPLWGEVRHGYFKLVGSIHAGLAAATWFAASAGAVAGDDAGGWAIRLAIATFVAIALASALMFARRETAARAVGFASVPIAAAVLVPLAQAGGQGTALGLFQLAAGAAFLGAVIQGLLLGHWYLTDRKLTRRPIQRFTSVLLVATVLAAVAMISGGFEPTPDTNSSLNPLLTAGALAPWIALGMAGSTLLIAVLVRLALRGERASAVQSATGFFYLAVVTAITAEVAVRTRFLPG